MKVVFAYPKFRTFEATLRRRLEPEHEVRFVRATQCEDPGVRFDDVDVLVTARFPAEWCARFPNLVLLLTAGAGVDKIELSALPDRTRVCCTSGHGPSIAEFVVMAMVALMRGVVPAERELRHDRWLNPQYDDERPLPRTLGEQTVVLLGTGEIGAATARLCRAHGMRCIGLNRTGRSPSGDDFERVLPLSDLRDVLPEADFVVVALPLTNETRGLMAETELRRMKNTACLINVARGPIVDEASLFSALRDGSIAGAALDVWYNYAPAGSQRAEPSRFPFRALDNVIMTPHLSGTTYDTFRYRAGDIADNILAFAAGRPLRNEIDRGAREHDASVARRNDSAS